MSDKIKDLLANIAQDDTVAATADFNSLLQDKMSDALDNEKIAVASSLYNEDENSEIEGEDYPEFEYEEEVETDQEFETDHDQEVE